MEIKTAYVNPPIPNRNFDWFAYVKDKEEDGRLRGWGSTQLEAICDLVDRIEETDEEEEE